MLNRLCVGLIGEGVQVTRIVSESQKQDGFDDGERRMALAARLEAPLRVLPWMRRTRISRIVEQLEKSPPDVLYAVGWQSWTLGIDLGKTLGIPVLLDVWAHRLIDQVPLGPRAGHVGGFVVPTQSIAQALAQRVGAELVSLVPMGVAARDEGQPTTLEPTNDPTLAILGDSRDITAYRAMLAGLSRAAREHPRMQIILELHGPHEHEVWREAGRLNLLGQISAISDLSRYRRLLNGCEIVLMPERFGELRSVMLEAMAQTSAFIVSAEVRLDMFIDGETALFVGAIEADGWASAVLRLLSGRDERKRLGMSAQRLVMRQYRSCNQVDGLIATFEGVLRGGAISFPGPNAKNLADKN